MRDDEGGRQSAGRRFYAAPAEFDFVASQVRLSEAEAQHLTTVLRLKTGEAVRVFDGQGDEYVCRVETIGKRGREVVLKLLEAVDAPCRESDFELVLCVALLKAEKFDWVIQKAVELGAMRVVPFQSARCEVRLTNEKSSARLARWRRIALEAAKQSGRARLMKIDDLASFDEVIKNVSGKDNLPESGAADSATAKPERRILFSERGGTSFNQAMKNLCDAKPDLRISSATVMTGAEGGWTDAELDTARFYDWQIVTLGGRILRAETAALTAAVLLQHTFGDLG